MSTRKTRIRASEIKDYDPAINSIAVVVEGKVPIVYNDGESSATLVYATFPLQDGVGEGGYELSVDSTICKEEDILCKKKYIADIKAGYFNNTVLEFVPLKKQRRRKTNEN